MHHFVVKVRVQDGNSEFSAYFLVSAEHPLDAEVFAEAEVASTEGWTVIKSEACVRANSANKPYLLHIAP